MSDYQERACLKCGSLVHHEDSCPTPQDTVDYVSRLTNKLHAYEKQWTDMDCTISHLRQENAELKARSKMDNEGNQEWINSLCKELCTMEDALGFKNDAYNKKGQWVPTIGPWMERLRDLLAAEGELGDLKEDLHRHKAALEKCAADNAQLKAELLCKETEWAKIFESLKCDLHRHKADLGRCREAMNIALFDTANTGHDSLHGLAECLSLIESPNPQPTQDPSSTIAYGLYPSSARPVNPKS